ncbi:RhoGEF domain-containing protein [Botrytis cinerea]
MNSSDDGGEPDDFYRDYQPLQQTNGPPDQLLDMAATTSDVRPASSTMRSSNTSSPPKQTPSTSRTTTRPPFGSNLSHAESNQKQSTKPLVNGYGKPSQKPSVKDLLKRFDQNNDQSLPMPRKPSVRTKDSAGISSGYMRDRSNPYSARVASNPGPTTTSSTLRASNTMREPGSTRVKSPSSSTRAMQRPRFATEDQQSSNASLGSARSMRTRNTPSTKSSSTSKSMNNLSPASQAQPPPAVPEKRPLFGEVSTLGQGTFEAGYGIPTATRRTSESGLPSVISTEQRSRTDADISPTSPTAWYLGVTPSLGDVEPNKPRRSGHNRAHSDFADTKVNTMHNVNRSSFLLPESPVNAKDSDPNIALDSSHVEAEGGFELQPPKLSSRLPIALKRSSTQSDGSSSPSTRASSPLTGKRALHGKVPRDHRPWSPAGRSMTSATRSVPPNSRAKTRSPDKVSSSGSLKAYISAPPAKKLPAITNSRQKAVDGSASPHDTRAGIKATRASGTHETKGRKTTNTEPVNYAARRAQITRAYTKSIHESELQKIRASHAHHVNEQSTRATNGDKSPKSEHGNTSSSGDQIPDMPSPGPESLQILTSFDPQISPPPVEHQIVMDQDSPTLGVTNGMPGAFIEEDVPMSAISNISATTFIENEAQTEAARLARIPSIKLADSVAVPAQVFEVDDVTPEDRAKITTDSYRISVEETSIGTTPKEDFSKALPESIDHDLTSEASESPSNVVTYDDQAKDIVTDLPSAKKLASEIFNPTSMHHMNFEAAAPASINHDIVQPTGLGLYDESSQQLVDIPIRIEEDTDSSQLHSESDTYSGEGPRLELPALRTALAESLSPLENDRQPDLYTPTDIEYESSDDNRAGNTGNTSEQEDLYGPSYDQNRELYLKSDTYHRENRNSAWTDFSVATTDDPVSQDENQKWINTKISLPELQKAPTPPPKLPPSPGPLRLIEDTSSENSSRLELPPLTSHNGFGLGFDSDTIYSVPTVPVWSDLTPPLISEHTSRKDAIANRPQSGTDQISQNTTSRHAESRRPSDDIVSPRPSLSTPSIFTPRSSMQISQEDVSLNNSYPAPKVPLLPLTEEEQAIAKKKSARLFTRRKIIEEIIDTESAYLKDMNVVEEIYKGTAEACPKLDFGDIKTIFRNTDEIIAFSTTLLDDLKKAGAAVYTSKARARQSKATSTTTTAANTPASLGPNDSSSDPPEFNDFNEERDRKTYIGYTFGKHLRRMQEVYTEFLKNSELAADRLKILSADPAVNVWLIECNNVAKDLTAAWDLDALMVKPVQRVTRYQLLIDNLVRHTAEDHPDFNALSIAARETLNLLQTIDRLKERISVVGKIVGRKRKESEVRLGIAKAFGRRSEKLTSNVVRPHDDEVFVKLHEKFGHDYLRLQVVMRDVEYYTRQVATWVNDFLRFLSAMEVVMRHSPSSHPEMEARWTQFNLSMRDMGSVALESHVGQIRKEVIEPIEAVIRLYSGPTEFMKKRAKRRVDYEKLMAVKANGKKPDEKLQLLAKEYDALNETLKTDMPRLSVLTAQIGQTILAKLIFSQTAWYYIWQEKVKTVLDANQIPMNENDILQSFERDYKYVLAQTQELRLINGTLEADCFLDRLDSTPVTSIKDNESIKTKGRLSDSSARPRVLSLAAPHDTSPCLPTPDFAKRHSGQFSFSPILSNGPGFPAHAPYQPAAYSVGHSRAGSGSPATPDASAPRLYGSTRPSTSRSITSDNGGMSRISTDLGHRRESSSTQASASYMVDGPLRDQRPFSGIFHSAMPLPDGPEDSVRSSRASSVDRAHRSRYNVIYLAASLFEFNIAATKTEAGYPYLTYSPGEIFDVIGEKGELWLAKNQDDGSDQVGWIWSKHFARLAMD